MEIKSSETGKNGTMSGLCCDYLYHKEYKLDRNKSDNCDVVIEFMYGSRRGTAA